MLWSVMNILLLSSTEKICVGITKYNCEIRILHFVDGGGTGLQGSYDDQQGYWLTTFRKNVPPLSSWVKKACKYYSGGPWFNYRQSYHLFYMLCLWFCASLICINNCPTIHNTKQSIYYSASSLYMFRVSTTPIIKSTQNCNYSLRYWSN